MSFNNQLPEKLETERLLIRVAQPGDGTIFNEAILESLESLTPWLSWVTPVPSIEESELGCRRAYAKFLLNEDLMVFFFLKSDGTLIGGSGLHDVDWRLRRFEIGYWGRTRYCGSGLITEGVKALTEYALYDLLANRVFLSTDAKNIRSCKLAERAGFELEGTLRNERFNLMGQLRDTRMYSRLA